MVPKTKGASRHMHLVSELHLIEELRCFNLQRRSWDQKALARDKRTQRWIVLVGIEAQDPDDGAPISAVCGLQELLGDGLSWSYTSSCVTREWVGEELFGEHRGVEAVDGKERGNDDKSRGAQPPTSKASVRMEVDSECHDATEAGLPIAKKGM
ncbi:hypothetical protein BHE74_00004686 [Ensete ventricosum]|nr:hypothetical protein BHE74_00004686 [Ensete ventricosum]